MQGIDIKPDAQGKVRDLYDLGDKLLLVATDRISAFDYILKDDIPYKGQVLTQLSCFWFELLADVVENHLISADVADLPEKFKPYADYLAGRFMLVRKAEMFPVECIVRGYLTGSGLKDYEKTGAVCGIELPAGLVNSSRLPEPIFTPSTKAEIGDHDENISFDKTAELIGLEDANAIKDLTLAICDRAAEHARERGLIIADTNSNSARWMARSSWATKCSRLIRRVSGRSIPTSRAPSQPSFDKQFVRNWLNANWDRSGEPPHLPEDVIKATSEKYIQAYEKITGKTFVAQ